MGAILLGLLYPFLLLQLCQFSHSSLPIGAHPLDEKFYESRLIKCKDGSKSFTRDRINDNFCDCHDGSDEPGTSACPSGKFYCKNVGSTPRFLFSSHVNDNICGEFCTCIDCCDGSDEYDGTINCPNTCMTGGNIAYHSITHHPTVRQHNSFHTGRNKLGLNVKESTDKLRGLKALLILQVVFVTLIMVYWAHRRHCRSRRRHSHLNYSDEFCSNKKKNRE